MLKKLRRKFILINMMLGSLVLLIVFGALLGSTSQRLRGQSVSAMRLALKWAEGMAPPQIEIEIDLPEGEEPGAGRGNPDARQLAMVPVFGVVLDENGNIDSYAPGGNVQVSQEALEQAVEEVQKQGVPEGTITKPGHLRYLVEWDRDGKLRIAFADMRWERENLMDLVVTSLLVGAGALVCFFFCPRWPCARWNRHGSSSGSLWPMPPMSSRRHSRSFWPMRALCSPTRKTRWNSRRSGSPSSRKRRDV